MKNKEDVIRRYYNCFTWWLWIHDPEVTRKLGTMDAESMKPYLLEWAKDITKVN